MRPDFDRFPRDAAHLHDLTESWESGAMHLASFVNALRTRERMADSVLRTPRRSSARMHSRGAAWPAWI